MREFSLPKYGTFLILSIIALLLFAASPALPQVGVAVQTPTIQCLPGKFITPHFEHTFDDAVVRRIHPFKRVAISKSYPAFYSCPSNTPDDFVLETAYYMESSWDAYETELRKANLAMPGPFHKRIPVNYVEPAPKDNAPLQFQHEEMLYREKIVVWLKPVLLSRKLHVRRCAHELFHFVQSHYVGAYKCSSANAGGKWWIEAGAEYASCDVAWTAANLSKYGLLPLMQVGGATYPNGLSNEKGGGFVRAYPYLLDEPLPYLGLPVDTHLMPNFKTDDWDKGEELEYDKGYFIQFLVDHCGANFLKMNDEVLKHYNHNKGPEGIFEPLDKYLRTAGTSLASAYGDFADYYLLSADSPIVRHSSGQGTATPLISVMKPPLGNERQPALIPAGVLTSPLSFHMDLKAGYSANMPAVELNRRQGGAPQPGRKLIVDAVQMDFCRARLFIGPKRTWFYSRVPPPTAELKSTGAHASITLQDSETLYIVAAGSDPESPGKAEIRISEGPSLSLVPLSLNGVKTAVPQTFRATLQNYFVTGAVRFMWKVTGPHLGKTIQGETKTSAGREESIGTAQPITFPEPGRYEIRSSAIDSRGIPIAESAPAICQVEASAPAPVRPAPGQGSATSTHSSGYWRLIDIKTAKIAQTAPDDQIIEFTASVSEGSMSGRITGDSHVGEGPATWGGQCSWTWRAPHGLDMLIPGEVIEGSMTLADQSVPEKVSGWQHGVTGVIGTIRIDRPYMPLGSVDASAVDLLNVRAPYQQTATQEGRLAVPQGPGWDGKIALAAVSSFGRVERVYEWSTGPYVPGRLDTQTSFPGRVWRVHEASSELFYDGVWTRRGSSNTFDAEWTGTGITDTITIESVSGDQVILFRSGNSGKYVGRLSPDRKRIVSGTMSWAPTFNWTATIE